MQFSTPQYFNALFLVPVIALFFLVSFAAKKKRSRVFSAPIAFSKISLNHSWAKDVIRAIVLIVALIFIIIALARPQWGEEQVEVTHKGIDVVFMMDASMSMLAEDINPSRFIKARLVIDSFVKRMSGNRLGFVLFAGNSYLACPLTIDHAAFRLFLNNAHVGAVTEQGTMLTTAFNTAIRAFGSNPLKDKVIVLLSDGEDHEGSLDAILALAKKHKFRIYCIGLGRKDGVPIPLKDEYGKVTGHKKDLAGETVITRLHDESLHVLAVESGGLYFPSSAAESEVDLIVRHLENIERSEFDSKLYKQKEEKYHLFLVIALMLLLIEGCIGMRRSRLFRLGGFFCFLPLLFMGFSVDFDSNMRQGNALYREGSYEEALEKYERAHVQTPDDAMVYYNMGNTQYQMQAFDKAFESYKKSLELAPEQRDVMKKVLYNLASAQYRNDNLEGALKTYKAVLDIDDEDIDSKHNIEVISNQIASQNQSDESKNQNKDQDQESDPDSEDNEGQSSGSGQSDSQDDQKDEKTDQEEESPGEGQGAPEDSNDEQSDEEEKSGDENDESQDDSDKTDADSSPQDSGDQESDNEQKDEQQQEDTTEQESEQQEQQEEQQSAQSQQEQQGSQQEPERVSEEERGVNQGQQLEQQSAAGEEAPRSMTKQDAERILDALQESEQDIGAMRYSSENEKDTRIQGKDW